MHEFNRSIEYMERYLSLARKTGDTAAQAAALTNLGSIYMQLGQVDASLALHAQAMRISNGETGEAGGADGEGEGETEQLLARLKQQRQSLAAQRSAQDAEAAQLDPLAAQRQESAQQAAVQAAAEAQDPTAAPSQAHLQQQIALIKEERLRQKQQQQGQGAAAEGSPSPPSSPDLRVPQEATTLPGGREGGGGPQT
eukprot:GAFH01004342.1.p2 GENE.GAFH01004342.1~~GAFH01004342.1.p2  ORF type:complete len:197 (+),score=71.44 GAFH01004342.1:100-690(+)